MTIPVTLRPTTPDDFMTIVHHRRAMFEAMGHTANLDAMDAAFCEWLRPRLERGEYLGWFALAGEQVVAGTGLWLMPWPAAPIDVVQTRGYILNVYTHSDYRRQGLARRLVTLAVEWCEAHNLATVELHASPQGRALYEDLGFKATNQMRRLLTR